MKALLFIFSLYSFTAGAGFWDFLTPDPDWSSNVRKIYFGKPFKIYSNHSGSGNNSCELVSGSTIVASSGVLDAESDLSAGACYVSFEGYVQKKLSDGSLCSSIKIEIDLPDYPTRAEYGYRYIAGKKSWYLECRF